MDKKENRDLYQILLTSGVIAGFITGIFSLIISLNTNQRLQDIEMQKHEYNLHVVRFEKLQESLEFFSKFKVYDTNFINNFDITSDEYTAKMIIDMMQDSTEEFMAQLSILGPYLSKEAVQMLEAKGAFEVELSKICGVEIDLKSNANDVNKAVKEHMESANKEIGKLNTCIIEAISYDIHNDYIPE